MNTQAYFLLHYPSVHELANYPHAARLSPHPLLIAFQRQSLLTMLDSIPNNLWLADLAWRTKPVGFCVPNSSMLSLLACGSQQLSAHTSPGADVPSYARCLAWGHRQGHCSCKLNMRFLFPELNDVSGVYTEAYRQLRHGIDPSPARTHSFHLVLD